MTITHVSHCTFWVIESENMTWTIIIIILSINWFHFFLIISNFVSLRGENEFKPHQQWRFCYFFRGFSKGFNDQPLHFYMRAPHLRHACKSMTTLIKSHASVGSIIPGELQESFCTRDIFVVTFVYAGVIPRWSSYF